MTTAAVVIEKWKLPIFTRHLRNAGYSYETSAGLNAGTLVLKVPYVHIATLQPIIQAAQNECARSKP